MRKGLSGCTFASESQLSDSKRCLGQKRILIGLPRVSPVNQLQTNKIKITRFLDYLMSVCVYVSLLLLRAELIQYCPGIFYLIGEEGDTPLSQVSQVRSSNQGIYFCILFEKAITHTFSSLVS